MLNCVSHIILDFDCDQDTLKTEDIFSYTGRKILSKVQSTEAVADTHELTLSFLGDLFPNLVKLRLNNSIVASVRDISSTFSGLRFLWLARCGLHSLDGISTISRQLEELHLAFNRIRDLTELMGLTRLKTLDLEGNEVSKLADCELLQSCSFLKALTLAGNPSADDPDYQEWIHQLLPDLVYLDEKKLIYEEAAATKPLHSGSECRPTCHSSESAEGSRDRVFTEYVLDRAEQRPPSARRRAADTKELWLRSK
jgi:Leucine-rich repeat (LRR) protein